MWKKIKQWLGGSPAVNDQITDTATAPIATPTVGTPIVSKQIKPTSAKAAKPVKPVSPSKVSAVKQVSPAKPVTASKTKAKGVKKS